MGFSLSMHVSLEALEDYTQQSWWTDTWWSEEDTSSTKDESSETDEPESIPGFGIIAVVAAGAGLALLRRRK